MLAAMPHLLQDATQPSDEHMQVVRNLKHRSNRETTPTVSVVAA